MVAPTRSILLGKASRLPRERAPTHLNGRVADVWSAGADQHDQVLDMGEGLVPAAYAEVAPIAEPARSF